MLALLFCFLIVMIVSRFYVSRKRYRGPITDHFNGKRFFNPGKSLKFGFFNFLKWQLTSTRVPWPALREYVLKERNIPASSSDGLVVTFVNHSTFLIQWHRLNFLTDPIWSERASPFSWIGPKRVHQPGLALDVLPRIDLILLTHNHYDHLDKKTLKRIYERDQPLVITGLGNLPLLNSIGIQKAVACDWWQEALHPFPNLSMIYTPAQHFSARGIFDRNQTLWGGFLIKIGDEMVYFAGDTAYCSVFKEIEMRYGKPKLSFLPIGVYEPRWFMKNIHMSAEDAVKAHLDLKSERSIGMHFGTFHLSDEGIDAPVELLAKTLQNNDIPSQDFLTLTPGEFLTVN